MNAENGVMKMVVVFLAEGFEEIEALTPVDILRRAGVDVKTVSVAGREVTGSHGIRVTADTADGDCVCDEDTEAVILPGGMPGTLNLEKSAAVQNALTFMESSGGYICAICAAPSVLGHRGMLRGKRATCFPGFEDQLDGAEVTGAAVERSGRIITSRGAGTAMDFALEIVSALRGEEASSKIAAAIQKP